MKKVFDQIVGEKWNPVRILHKQFEAAKPMFMKGGKLERLYPLFEAKETFLFTPGTATADGSHIRDAIDSKRLMSTVIVALIPCLLFGIYNVGYQHYQAIGAETYFLSCIVLGLQWVLPIVIVSYAAGGICELIFAVVRRHEINEGFLVTGLLIPLTMPPTVPLWQVAVATVFGVVVGKEIFGGTGYNIFNPALTARAFLFFAYPASISGEKVWAFTKGHAPLDTVWTWFGGNAPLLTNYGGETVQGYSGATPLLVASSASEAGVGVTQKLAAFGPGFADFSWSNMFLGFIPGSIGETSVLMCLFGAVYLILTGVGSWRIMLGCVTGGVVMALCTNTLADPGSIMALPPHYHLVMGGFMFGTVFMATDPVSAAATSRGQWMYGILIGAVAIIIRAINPAYPEGMMLSILFLNMFSPLIDRTVLEANIRRRQSRAHVR